MVLVLGNWSKASGRRDRQAINPSFTALQIFRIRESSCLIVVRELGLANICLGVLGIGSIVWPSWRMPAAIAGGLYFGLAGLIHVFKPADTVNEIVAMVSDLFIFFVMILYLLFSEGHIASL